MSRRKPRGLRPEEEALWQRVAQTASPLSQTVRQAVVDMSAPKPIKPKPKFKAEPFEMGSYVKNAPEKRDFSPTLGAVLENRPLRMDKKTFGKMKRGKALPEAKIDLHGKTVAAAHGVLTAFVFRAHGEGKRLVLVITGKGRMVADDSPIPSRTGVLRHHLPHWLSTPPLSAMVLQVTEAHQRHGGSGAFYVYLSRRR